MGNAHERLKPADRSAIPSDAGEFLETLVKKGVKADCIIFDPPYSLRQVKECYENVGRKFLQADAQNAGHWAKEKNLCAELLEPNGVFLHFGWHSNGIGEKRGFAIERILLVAHGRAHHDTICTVERKRENCQRTLEFAA